MSSTKHLFRDASRQELMLQYSNVNIHMLFNLPKHHTFTTNLLQLKKEHEKLPTTEELINLDLILILLAHQIEKSK